jgi:hypothetical protein
MYHKITIVSGLPRSGTSMMMKMLEAGGMPILADHLRAPDVDNPKGYYEYERVKQLDKGDHAWLADASGKAVKVISALLEYLPASYAYKVIFMHRRMEEILASQRRMLRNRGEPFAQDSDEEMGQLFEQHLVKVKTWLQTQPHILMLHMDYNQMVANPHPQIQALNNFLDNMLDEARMLAIVDAGLYRTRTERG